MEAFLDQRVEALVRSARTDGTTTTAEAKLADVDGPTLAVSGCGSSPTARASRSGSSRGAAFRRSVATVPASARSSSISSTTP
jgi:hypothetical protein